MNFYSDNVGVAAPEVMDAVVRANEGYVLSYGRDPWTDRAVALVREVLEAPEAAVYMVPTGTSANALALATLANPWDAVFVHADSHAENDEAGAPEFYTGGAKLHLVEGDGGKMTVETLSAALTAYSRGNVHSVQPGPVSITQISELGTAYGVDEIRALTTLAHDAGSKVHMDGARFANAVAAAGCSPAEMTWKAGVDALSFGGTKNGCLGVEAVVLFDPALAWEFEMRRKRAGHLWSKLRFLSAQMVGYLEDGTWLKLAGAANARMTELMEGLRGLNSAHVPHPPAGNLTFVDLPRAAHARAYAGGAFYGLRGSLDGDPDEILRARLVCDWSRTPEDVAALIELWRG